MQCNYKRRLKNLGCIVVVILMGLLSRRISGIPLWIGDALYAVMMYFIVAFIKPNLENWRIGGYALLLVFMVEVSQLYQAPWINQIRQTLVGHLVLGQGFLVSDLCAYTVGIFTVVGMRYLLEKR